MALIRGVGLAMVATSLVYLAAGLFCMAWKRLNSDPKQPLRRSQRPCKP